MKMRRSHAYISSGAFLFVLMLPFFAYAQSQSKPQNVLFQGATFCEYMTSVFNFSVGIVGTLTVVMIIFGGAMYATSGGNTERIGNAKDVIVASLVGMFLVLGSYLLFQTLAPNYLKCTNDPGGASESSSGSTGSGTGTGGNSFKGQDKALKDICEGKQVFADKSSCDGTSGAGTCLKGKTGYCRSTCGSGAAVVSAFRDMKGMCIITNHCAFTTNQALQQSGCADFRGISSTTATAGQLKAWGFKEYKYDASNPAQSLANIKPGAVLIFKGTKAHTAVYTGNNKMIDATVGYYSQCPGLNSQSSKAYKSLIGKDLECAKKNRWNDRNPTIAGNENKKTRTGYPYTGLNSPIQCVAEHSFKNGKPYNTTSYPLVAYYQPE